MEDRRCKLTGDLVHVGDHQQQTLGSGEGGAQCTGTQGTMDGTGNTGFRLHLGDDRDGTPDILLFGSGFGIGFGSHR